MNMNKKNKSIIAVYGILAFIYLIAFVIIPFPKNAASWISFVFTLISFVLSLGVSLYVFGKEDEMTSKFYGFPIFKIAYMYPLMQFAVGVIICIIAAFVAVPYWIALILSLIILGASAIGVIATDNARDIIENNNNGVRSILDFLTQDKIATLTAENQSLKLAASQARQNNYLIEQLKPCPVPAYVVANPNCCATPAYNFNTCLA